MSGSMTGGVNADIPLQAGRGVQQPNALQQIGQFAATQNLLNSNRLFPLQQQQMENQLALFPGQLQQQQQATQGGAVNLSNLVNRSVYQSLTPLLALPPATPGGAP